MRRKYQFIVPVIRKFNPILEREVIQPRCPNHIGYRVLAFSENTVLVEVTIGGYNYLIKRKYAELFQKFK